MAYKVCQRTTNGAVQMSGIRGDDLGLIHVINVLFYLVAKMQQGFGGG